MIQIFTDLQTRSEQKCQKLHFDCLLPVVKSVHIRGIPRYTVKTIHYEEYFCNIIFGINVFLNVLCLTDAHRKMLYVFSDLIIVKFS